MKHNINSLIGLNVQATDGGAGETEDLYFDDESWIVRYLVVNTGSWLSGRKVLIPFATLQSGKFAGDDFSLNLTQDQIKNSPDIDTAKPVSRQKEEELNTHHFLGIYWGGGDYGGGMGAGEPPHVTLPANEKAGDDVHLRSVADTSGYQIHALDGEIGHVNDLIVDDETWRLLYFVVDTHNIIGGKKVLVNVSDVKTISFEKFEVFVNITMADIEQCPLYEEEEYHH